MFRCGSRSALVFAFWAFVVVAGARPARACPFCEKLGDTLADEIDESNLVFVGAVVESRAAERRSVLRIGRILKGHSILEGGSTIEIQRYLPVPPGERAERLVFAQATESGVVPFRFMPVDSADLVDYLADALAIRSAAGSRRLGSFFDYLGHPDPVIAQDAYKEFAKASYDEVAGAREHFDPDRIAGWIRDPNTPGYRIGLLGLMLGICGRAEDRPFLMECLSKSTGGYRGGLDGLMAGYCLLDPKNGPNFLLDVLTHRDPVEGLEQRNNRYSAVQALRFVLARIPAADHREIFRRLGPAIAIEDVADFVIDLYRQQEVWNATSEILARAGDPLDRTRRSIVMYAVRCPDPKAERFVERLRAEAPQLLRDAEESLEFEKELAEQFGGGYKPEAQAR